MWEELSREATDLAKAQFFLLLASSQLCNFQIPLSLSDFSPLLHARSFTLCFLSGFFRAETRTGKRPGFFLMRQGAFGSAVQPAFQRISNFFFFFFAKIECDLYLLDRFDVLISKMIFKK